MRKPITWDQMFLEMAFNVSKRSKDDSTQCGAVLVGVNNVLISTGFNGPPPQLDDSLVPWNVRPKLEDVNGCNYLHKYACILHAEENALLFGLEARGNVAGSTMYVTHYPCSECTLRMIRSRVRRVVIPSCHKPYPLSKFQVEPNKIIAIQAFPKLEIHLVDFIKPE